MTNKTNSQQTFALSWMWINPEPEKKSWPQRKYFCWDFQRKIHVGTHLGFCVVLCFLPSSDATGVGALCVHVCVCVSCVCFFCACVCVRDSLTHLSDRGWGFYKTSASPSSTQVWRPPLSLSLSLSLSVTLSRTLYLSVSSPTTLAVFFLWEFFRHTCSSGWDLGAGRQQACWRCVPWDPRRDRPLGPGLSSWCSPSCCCWFPPALQLSSQGWVTG